MSLQQYFIRRPRALQYTRAGREVRAFAQSAEEHGHELLPLSSDEGASKHTPGATESMNLQRSHLDLFIDLIFVGIVSNLSEHFSEEIFTPKEEEGIPSGTHVFYALLEFELLFLLTWRVWNFLRSFTNMYFLDDILQRMFIMWILICAVVLGNSSPWAFDDAEGGRTVLAIYLVIRTSFFVMEGFYVAFNVFLWKEFAATFILALPPSGLLIGSMFTSDWTSLGLLLAAMLIEYLTAYILHSPIANRLLADGYRKSLDLEHYTERIGSFFVIILGEGVILLLRGSPLGQGITPQVGTGVAVLALYFCLHMFYFRTNHNSHSVATVRQATWKLGLWQFCHVLLFSSMLILDIVNLFVVEHIGATADEPPEEPTQDEPSAGARRLLARATSGTEDLTSEELPHFMKAALWTGSAALACVMFSLSCLHLLDHNVKHSKGHMVDNVFVRLAPRIALVAIIPCLPLVPHLTGAAWVGLVVGLVYIVIAWELSTGFRKGGSLFEPKRSQTEG